MDICRALPKIGEGPFLLGATAKPPETISCERALSLGHIQPTSPIRVDPGFFFSLFNFRFSFGFSRAFFCCSLLPLSFFPLSPISVSPCLEMTCAGLWRIPTTFVRKYGIDRRLGKMVSREDAKEACFLEPSSVVIRWPWPKRRSSPQLRKT